jgi:glutaredoxin 3
MATKRTIAIFSAGCPACEETVTLVNRIACSSCDVTVLDTTIRPKARMS